MRIANLRLGHACNSSSSHSIVPLALLGAASDDYDPGEFGWGGFQLASPGAKMEYLAATLSGRLADDDITALTGIEPVGTEPWDKFGSVDHQSLMAVPVSGRYAQQFMRELADYLRRDDVVILGGNDNGGYPTAAHLPIPLEAAEPKVRPGTAPDGTPYWTVMEGRRGDRVRFTFTGQPLSGRGDHNDYGEASRGLPALEAEPFDLPYADLPELVDMKVTGFCPFEKDCPWCYMDSNTKGKHVGRARANAWLGAFADAGVFEVALGGGEPTLWPHLPSFLRRAAKLGVNVNLTTKNIAWIKPENLTGLHAIAVSINNARDLKRFCDLDFSALPKYTTEITLQCVPAFCDTELLQAIIAAAHERRQRLTFLGVKRVGRAAAEERPDDLRWLSELEKYSGDYWLRRGIAVDTLMAAAAEPEFVKLGVDPVWYETSEGRFSCYVDATRNLIGTSSYVGDDELLETDPEHFGESFRTAQTAGGIRP
jgi:hypothetical protein